MVKVTLGFVLGAAFTALFMSPYETQVLEMQDMVDECSTEWFQPCTFLAVPDSEVELIKTLVNSRRTGL